MPNYKVHSNNKYSEINSDHFIEISEGPFIGTHFNFGQIEFAGEDGEGNGKINYDYNLLSIPETVILDMDRPLLEREIGKILQSILETLVPNNETGTSDTESTTEGRGLSEEGDTLPEG